MRASLRARVIIGQISIVSLAVTVTCVAAIVLDGRPAAVALAGAGVVAVAALGAVALTARLLRPLRTLQASIEQISRGGVERLAAHCGAPELRRLVERVNEMAAVAQSQRLFLADVTHQLRTELHLLTVRLEQLCGNVTPAGAEPLERAVADAERLRNTLTEHLEYARLIHSSGPVKVDLGEVARERSRAWSEVAARRGVRMVAAPGGAAAVLTRRGVPEQLLDILLDNAIKHSPRGGTITVGLWADGSAATVQVLDQGPGMTPEQRSHATRRGWRADHRDGEGAGLGLSIAALLAASNGGRLVLGAAQEGSGLDARCTFPLVD